MSVMSFGLQPRQRTATRGGCTQSAAVVSHREQNRPPVLDSLRVGCRRTGCTASPERVGAIDIIRLIPKIRGIRHNGQKGHVGSCSRITPATRTYRRMRYPLRAGVRQRIAEQSDHLASSRWVSTLAKSGINIVGLKDYCVDDIKRER